MLIMHLDRWPLPAIARLHAHGETEADDACRGGKVESCGDAVEEGELLVDVGHGVGWLRRARARAKVSEAAPHV